jgi:hypothetical protein
MERDDLAEKAVSVSTVPERTVDVVALNTLLKTIYCASKAFVGASQAQLVKGLAGHHVGVVGVICESHDGS